MIDRNIVKNIVDQWLNEQSAKKYFLVDVNVSTDNKIIVEIDHADGVWIEDCVELSQFIEKRLNRNIEDYELEVGSAGLGQPFKVPQQYLNFIGKNVEVMDNDGKKYRGELTNVNGNEFIVAVSKKTRLKNQKDPAQKIVEHVFQMDKVKYTKYLICFR